MKVDKTKWKCGTIDEHCIIQLGTRVVKKNVDEGEFPVYGGGGATFTTSTYNRENAILISRFAMSKKCTRFVQGKFFLNDSGLTIIPKENTLLFHYLKWNIFAINDKIYSLGKGVAQKNLDMKRFPFLLLSIPPVDEQQGIASELDAIQEVIDGYKAQLADLDVLAQSIFLDTFGDPISNPKGWKKKSLGTLCEVSSAKRVLVKDIVSEGVPFIRGTELAILSKQCFFDKSIFSMFITPEHYDKVKAITGVPEIDDLLIPSINPYGYVWRINTTEPIYFKDGRVIWIHTNHSIYNGDCLRHILVYEILEKYSKLSGAVFAELTLVFLRTLKIIVPPLPLQQSFAKQVEAIEKQKNLLREQLKDAETLMAERMQYYFS